MPLILNPAPIGDNEDDYEVLDDGVLVGRIFKVLGDRPCRRHHALRMDTSRRDRKQ